MHHQKFEKYNKFIAFIEPYQLHSQPIENWEICHIEKIFRFLEYTPSSMSGN